MADSTFESIKVRQILTSAHLSLLDPNELKPTSSVGILRKPLFYLCGLSNKFAAGGLSSTHKVKRLVPE